jgi:hypothetical protein
LLLADIDGRGVVADVVVLEMRMGRHAPGETRSVLSQAVSLFHEDADEQKQRRRALTMNLLDGAKAFDRDLETVKEIAAEYDPAQAEGRGEHLSPERLRKIAAFAEALAVTMEEKA